MKLVKDECTSGNIALDSYTAFAKCTNRVFRLPAFIAGASILGKVGFDVFNYLTGNELDPNTGWYIASSIGLLGLSSSMYLKDRDPKLLEKQPSKLGAKLKETLEKLKGLFPKPIPLPVPQPNFQQAELTSELFSI